MARVVNSRIRLLLFVIVLSFAILLGRAAWISTVRAASLSKLAQQQTKAPVVLPAGRGTIFDSMGTPLAIGEQATTVYADPRQVTHPATAAKTAARVLGLKAGTLYPLLADRTHGFVYVERKAPAAKATALAKLKLPGFGFYAEERRTYPQGPLAAQVLGFAGVDNKGLAGLELQLDGSLTGTPGSETIVRDPFGRPIDIQGVVPAREGKAAFLSLNERIQANAEQVLRATRAQWRAKDATAIVLDPRTGGVLAMAMEPGYDANNFPTAAKGLPRNHAVTDFFEPGSVFKVVTVAGALSEGLVSPQTKFTLPYSIHVADRVIHDAEPRGTETMTVAQILQRSSNVGAITIAKMLGKDKLLYWINRFGFGKTTGIDFPGESAGLLPGYWSGSTIGNVPIGQGVSVTAIQLATVYAAIANGGVWTQPHLVDHVQGEKPAAPKTRRILSPRVDHELLSMLKGVVSDAGTAAAAEIPGYSVAGKTGTAQKPSPRGGYAAGKYVATFVGMVPASNPKLVVLVTVDEPTRGIFGGLVAAPAFAQIAAFDLQYLEVPPDLALR
ncbi:MAG TPA: penicillin-binding protein 2 [Gaiellaceae bacterium]|jgi:cell division protein FtsI/penicillin-binding protein 2|nr:penicillin-binding protein 2 [Gaiellaceae bacterium]